MNLIDLIKHHEGVRLDAYTDGEGNPTIGVGFNLNRQGALEALAKQGLDYNHIVACYADAKAKGLDHTPPLITMAQAEALLQTDVDQTVKDLRTLFPDFDFLPDGIRLVLVDVCFNIGLSKLRNKWPNTVAAFKRRDWKAAADDIESNHVWHSQVGKRLDEDVAILRAVTEP